MCSTRSGPNLALGFQIHTSKGPGRAPARTPPGLARKCSMYMPCAQLRRLSTRRRAHMADAFIARVEGEYCDRPVRRGAPTAGSLPCCGARRGELGPRSPRAEKKRCFLRPRRVYWLLALRNRGTRIGKRTRGLWKRMAKSVWAYSGVAGRRGLEARPYLRY